MCQDQPIDEEHQFGNGTLRLQSELSVRLRRLFGAQTLTVTCIMMIDFHVYHLIVRVRWMRHVSSCCTSRQDQALLGQSDC